MSDQLDVLKTVACKLEDAAIPYMVSGSVAMNFYAQPRMTRDIDIVIELSLKDISRVHALFATEFYIDEQDVHDSIRELGIFNIIHNRSMVKVDFIVKKDSDFRKEEFTRRQTISLEEVKVSVVTPEDLILSKLDWAKESLSEMQLNDVRNLVAANPNLDWKYLKLWSDRLGVADQLESVRKS